MRAMVLARSPSQYSRTLAGSRISAAAPASSGAEA